MIVPEARLLTLGFFHRIEEFLLPGEIAVVEHLGPNGKPQGVEVLANNLTGKEVEKLKVPLDTEIRVFAIPSRDGERFRGRW